MVAVVQAFDGTWHRPFTTLGLVALQSLVGPEEQLELDGRPTAHGGKELERRPSCRRRGDSRGNGHDVPHSRVWADIHAEQSPDLGKADWRRACRPATDHPEIPLYRYAQLLVVEHSALPAGSILLLHRDNDDLSIAPSQDSDNDGPNLGHTAMATVIRYDPASDGRDLYVEIMDGALVGRKGFHHRTLKVPVAFQRIYSRMPLSINQMRRGGIYALSNPPGLSNYEASVGFISYSRRTFKPTISQKDFMADDAIEDRLKHTLTKTIGINVE
jgi:hypothetical protein